MPKKLIEIASELVQTQVSLSPMSATDISNSLKQVFTALQEMQKSEETGAVITISEQAGEEVPGDKPALKPEDSIQNDKVICLECGAEFRQLTERHLKAHGMNAKEYKSKYGFAMRTPLAAKSLTKARSKAAKKRGLPEKLAKYLEARRQSKAEAAAGGQVAEQDKEVKKTVVRRKKVTE